MCAASGSTTDNEAKKFLALPGRRRLVWLSLSLLVAVVLWSELDKWNLFAPGGVLEEPRPFPSFPHPGKGGVDGFWDGTEPVTERDQLGSVWLYFVWTFG